MNFVEGTTEEASASCVGGWVSGGCLPRPPQAWPPLQPLWQAACPAAAPRQRRVQDSPTQDAPTRDAAGAGQGAEPPLGLRRPADAPALPPSYGLFTNKNEFVFGSVFFQRVSSLSIPAFSKFSVKPERGRLIQPSTPLTKA